MGWQERCPARAADLRHAHDARCPDGHAPDQCCECGGFPIRPPTPVVNQLEMPPIDIFARARALGLTPVEDLNPQPPHDWDFLGFDLTPTDDTPREPRSITGNGPSGPDWHWGRGEATPRFLERVAAFVGFVARFGPPRRYKDG